MHLEHHKEPYTALQFGLAKKQLLTQAVEKVTKRLSPLLLRRYPSPGYEAK